MSDVLTFTRPTMLAAAVLLERMTQAKFDQMVQRLGLNAVIPFGDVLSVPKKVVQLSHQVLLNPTQQVLTRDGVVSLGEALVREAVALMSNGAAEPSQEDFRRSLARDGFVVSWDAGECAQGSPPWLRSSLPASVNMPKSDDELHALLKRFGMQMATAHLDQAIDCHTRGDWAAANAQFRTFMEQLINSITAIGFASQDAPTFTMNNRVQLLGRVGFFSLARGEWAEDGKGFIQGLLRMLHSDGSHPGLSDEEHSTYKLHLTLLTASTLLRRLQVGMP